MSTNFKGVTFAMQNVLPSDDAIVRRKLLPDGILSGCALSYSGTTLTMATGHLVICGRQVRLVSAQNWQIVDASSGYARLLLTIDLTRASTKDNFDQVVTSVEYASAVDGFAQLIQEDINEGGTRYQVAICTVSLSTGGISGFTSKISSVGAAPASHKHSASDINSGTLGVARGGTGRASHAANAVLAGNGASAVNNVPTANGALYATAANGAAKFGTLPIAQGGTGATTAASALKNLGGVSMKLLWTNAKPTSEFAKQTISLSLSGYDMIIVCAKEWSGATEANNWEDVTFAKIPGKGFLETSRLSNGYRTFTTASNSIAFDDFYQVATANGAVSIANTGMIPFHIYGIKGVAQ